MNVPLTANTSTTGVYSDMDLPSKLLSFYVSLVEEGVPVSLNIWTEKGSEGQHFFRISSSVPRKKTAFNAYSQERPVSVQNVPQFNPSTPPPVITTPGSPDRPRMVKGMHSTPPQMISTPGSSDRPRIVTAKHSTPPPSTDTPPPPKNDVLDSEYVASVTIKNRFSVLQNEDDETNSTPPDQQHQCPNCNKPISMPDISEDCMCDGCTFFGPCYGLYYEECARTSEPLNKLSN